MLTTEAGAPKKQIPLEDKYLLGRFFNTFQQKYGSFTPAVSVKKVFQMLDPNNVQKLLEMKDAYGNTILGVSTQHPDPSIAYLTLRAYEGDVTKIINNRFPKSSAHPAAAALLKEYPSALTLSPSERRDKLVNAMPDETSREQMRQTG